jgi:hypothetical protein
MIYSSLASEKNCVSLVLSLFRPDWAALPPSTVPLDSPFAARNSKSLVYFFTLVKRQLWVLFDFYPQVAGWERAGRLTGEFLKLDDPVVHPAPTLTG